MITTIVATVIAISAPTAAFVWSVCHLNAWLDKKSDVDEQTT